MPLHSLNPPSPLNPSKAVRFLFVSHSLPYPPTNGGNQRTALLLRALQEIGDVDLLLMHGEQEPDADTLRHLDEQYQVLACVPMPRRAEREPWRTIRPLFPKTIDRLAHHLGRDADHYQPHPRIEATLKLALAARSYDVIIGRYLKPTAISGALSQTPLILDIDDLDYEVWRSRLADPATPAFKHPIIRHHLRQLKALVPPLLARCDHLWVSNELNLSELSDFPVSLLSNIPYLSDGSPVRMQPPPEQSLEILTVASCLQERNVEGIDFFVNEAWPLVREQVPEATFKIVGSHMRPALRERWGAVPGMVPVGFVEDLSEVYRTCAFTVAPLFYGGGTNIKVLESLSYGRTCVVTPFVHRGFQTTLPHMEALYLAADAPAMARACIDLLDNPTLAVTLARQGAARVEKHYSFDRFREVVQSTVYDVLETPKHVLLA